MNTIPCGPNHSIVVSYAQIEGTHHHKKHLASEDVVFIRKTQDYLFCGLADGQSNTKYGARGGGVCLEAVSNYIESVGIHALIHFPFPDELPCTIVKAFRKELLSLAESTHESMKEFASTFLAVAVDLRTGEYMLLHLGDGCAIGIPHVGEPVFISNPDNSFAPNQTWLTASDNVISHFRISFGSIKNKKRLLLMSDGATCFCRGRNIPWRAKELLTSGNHAQLQNHLILSNPIDDASCIFLDFCNNECP